MFQSENYITEEWKKKMEIKTCWILFLIFAYVELQILACFSPLLLSGLKKIWDIFKLLIKMFCIFWKTLAEPFQKSCEFPYLNCLLPLFKFLMYIYFLVILSFTCSLLDLILEIICLEGSWRQGQVCCTWIICLARFWPHPRG